MPLIERFGGTLLPIQSLAGCIIDTHESRLRNETGSLLQEALDWRTNDCRSSFAEGTFMEVQFQEKIGYTVSRVQWRAPRPVRDDESKAARS